MTLTSVLPGAEREHRRVDLRAVHVVRDRPARVLHRLRIVTGEVAADLVPRLAAVGRLPDVLRRGVEHVRIDRREDDRDRSTASARRPRSRSRPRRSADTARPRAVSPVRRLRRVRNEPLLRAGEEDVDDPSDPARCSRARRRRRVERRAAPRPPPPPPRRRRGRCCSARTACCCPAARRRRGTARASS